MPDAEVILWSKLRYWPHLRFRRQHPIGPYIADFACIPARLVIEVDGDTHGSDAGQVHDARRDSYMTERGWCILRVHNADVYKNLNAVLDIIAHHAPSTASRSPSPARGGGK
jgi:very-short-patch-repair endonuclease